MKRLLRLLLIAALVSVAFAQTTGGTIVAIPYIAADGTPGTVTASAGPLSCTATGDKPGASSVRITCTNGGVAQPDQTFTPTQPTTQTFPLTDAAGDSVTFVLSFGTGPDKVARITWVAMAVLNGGKLASLVGVL